MVTEAPATTDRIESPRDDARSVRGIVFDIQKFSLHDGSGIRTTVFLKGCPLRCLWCHNPESQDARVEVSFIPEMCLSCGRCAEACPRGCHRDVDGRHVFVRDRCGRCGACADACPSGALERLGRSMNVAEVMREVLRDKPFYDESGGGMTVSGGEPMARFAFTCALLSEASSQGVHTCIETSGYGPTDRYVEVAANVDVFLFDVKETDPDRHQEYTGVPLEGILHTLRELDARGAQIVLRCPVVPGLCARDERCDGIAGVANGLKSVREIHLLPYHPLGISKCERTGRIPAFTEIESPGRAEMERWVRYLAARTAVPVRCG